MRNDRMAPFYHGVASGDPLANQVIIWTRVTPMDSNEIISVSWEISKEPQFAESVQYGSVNTSRSRDWTVKVDVQNLDPGTYYYYRFTAKGEHSIIGRTKTASQSADSLHFAVASCSNFDLVISMLMD